TDRADIRQAGLFRPREYTLTCSSKDGADDQNAVLGREASSAVVETGRIEIHNAAGLGPHERMLRSTRDARVADNYAAAGDALRNGEAAAEVADRHEALCRSPDEAEHFSPGRVGGAGGDAVGAYAADKVREAAEPGHDETGLRAPHEAQPRTVLEIAANDAV